MRYAIILILASAALAQNATSPRRETILAADPGTCPSIGVGYRYYNSTLDLERVCTSSGWGSVGAGTVAFTASGSITANTMVTVNSSGQALTYSNGGNPDLNCPDGVALNSVTNGQTVTVAFSGEQQVMFSDGAATAGHLATASPITAGGAVDTGGTSPILMRYPACGIGRIVASAAQGHTAPVLLSRTLGSGSLIYQFACIDAGSANAYGCTGQPNYGALTVGSLISPFKPSASNTISTPTLTIGIFSANTVCTITDPSGNSLTSGALQAGHSYSLTYHSSSPSICRLLDSGTVLAGDVSGGTNQTTVMKIQGRAVSSAAPSDGQSLAWKTANNDWEPQTISGGGGGGGATAANQLTDAVWTRTSGSVATLSFPTGGTVFRCGNVPISVQAGGTCTPSGGTTLGTTTFYTYLDCSTNTLKVDTAAADFTGGNGYSGLTCSGLTLANTGVGGYPVKSVTIARLTANTTNGNQWDIWSNSTSGAINDRALGGVNWYTNGTGIALTYDVHGLGTFALDQTVAVKGSALQPASYTFAGAPTCNAGAAGSTVVITDSNTVTWGAAVAGSSTNTVLAQCNGSAYTVIGK